MVRVRFSRVWRAVLCMGYPLVRWSLQMMTQNGGKTAQFQGDHERCLGSTTKFGGMWDYPTCLDTLSPWDAPSSLMLCTDAGTPASSWHTDRGAIAIVRSLQGRWAAARRLCGPRPARASRPRRHAADKTWSHPDA